MKKERRGEKRKENVKHCSKQNKQQQLTQALRTRNSKDYYTKYFLTLIKGAWILDYGKRHFPQNVHIYEDCEWKYINWRLKIFYLLFQ